MFYYRSKETTGSGGLIRNYVGVYLLMGLEPGTERLKW